MHKPPTGAFTSRLSTGRSPFPSLDITTTVSGLLCWRDSHPLEWQLASLNGVAGFAAGGSSSDRKRSRPIYFAVGGAAVTAQDTQPGRATFAEMIAFARLASVPCQRLAPDTDSFHALALRRLIKPPITEEEIAAFVPSRRRRMMANVRAERLLKIPAEPSRCSSNASGLPGRNSARILGIRVSFQRDNLRRHFGDRGRDAHY